MGTGAALSVYYGRWEMDCSNQSQAGLVKAHSDMDTWYKGQWATDLPIEDVLEQQLNHQHKCVMKIELQLDITYSFQETFPPLFHQPEQKLCRAKIL